MREAMRGPKAAGWRRMIAGATSAGLLAVGFAAPAAAAGLDGVVYTYSVSFPANATSATGSTISPTTAAGQVFVIQTVSIYRHPASPSTLQAFIGVTYGGKPAFFALPDISNATDHFPAVIANLTAYVTAGTNAFANLYRTGSSLPAETDYITVSGYITPRS